MQKSYKPWVSWNTELCLLVGEIPGEIQMTLFTWGSCEILGISNAYKQNGFHSSIDISTTALKGKSWWSAKEPLLTHKGMCFTLKYWTVIPFPLFLSMGMRERVEGRHEGGFLPCHLSMLASVLCSQINKAPVTYYVSALRGSANLSETRKIRVH